MHDTTPIDFNQDGRPDLAAISYPDPNYGYATLWRNDSGVGLTYLSRFTLGTQLGRIIAANIVGDARIDLVVSDTAYTRVSVLRATGEPLADVNDDGVVDGLDLTRLLSEWDYCSP